MKNAARAFFQDVGLVVAAGGSGRRFGSEVNKLLVDFAGLPVLLHSLRRFCRALPPRHTVLVASAEAITEVAALMRSEGLSDRVVLLVGGAERQDSVSLGLAALPAEVDIVAIHDAARPRATLALFSRCVEVARAHGSGVAASAIRDTVKRVAADDVVLETLDRDALRATETPQVFRRELIVDAYRRLAAVGRRVTDDAQAVELSGGRVHLVVHDEDNRKVTYPADILGEWTAPFRTGSS